MGGGILQLKNHKVQQSDNFQFWGGGYSATEKSQSAKIYLNWNFRKGEGGGGYSATEKSQSANNLPKLEFSRGGILQLKNHKVTNLPNFRGGGGISN